VRWRSRKAPIVLPRVNGVSERTEEPPKGVNEAFDQHFASERASASERLSVVRDAEGVSSSRKTGGLPTIRRSAEGTSRSRKSLCDFRTTAKGGLERPLRITRSPDDSLVDDRAPSPVGLAGRSGNRHLRQARLFVFPRPGAHRHPTLVRRIRFTPHTRDVRRARKALAACVRSAYITTPVSRGPVCGDGASSGRATGSAARSRRGRPR
jgi:hypothetical protein